MSKLRDVILLGTGLAIGVGGTYVYMEKSYLKKRREEFAQIREDYRLKYAELEEALADLDAAKARIDEFNAKFGLPPVGTKDEDVKEVDVKTVKEAKDEVKESRKVAAKIVEEEGYTRYSNAEREIAAKEEPTVTDARVTEPPYQIDPSLYGEDEDYETYSYNLYDDGIITNERDLIVSDIDFEIGWDNVRRLIHGTTNAIYVRNETLMRDYEITFESNYTFLDFYENMVEDPEYIRMKGEADREGCINVGR